MRAASTAAVERADPPPHRPPGVQDDALAEAARRDFQFLWRVLRRMGVQPDDAVDDAIQHVFEVAARKRERIAPGSERAFLYKTALLVAADARRRQQKRLHREQSPELEVAGALPDPEQHVQAKQHRALLDLVLDAMSADTREVFVMFELEQLSTAEIATLVGVPLGTVASRLRRGRAEFRAAAARVRAREGLVGGIA